MKRSIFSKTLALILCLLLAFSAFSVNVFAANEDADLDMNEDQNNDGIEDSVITTIKDVYLSTSGNDSNDGSVNAPFATLKQALTKVANGGTINIVDSYTVPADFNWVTRNVTNPVTITGGTLSLASTDLVIGYDVNFENITISGSNSLYANGNNVTFKDGANATAINVYGGNKSGETLKSTNLTINGGNLGNVYGGSSVDCKINQVNLTINGGTVANVIGGNNASNLTGDVTVYLNGGTITDSIFGGCFNKYTYKSGLGNWGASITWDTTHYVTGKVDVIVSEKATINTNDSSGTDKAFFAHSRHKTLSENEDTSIIFTSQTAYNNNSSKFGTKASAPALGGTANNLLSAGMGANEASAADNIHIHGLSSDDTADTITEGCNVVTGTENYPCGSAVVATLSLDNEVFSTYTGEEITPAVVKVTGGILSLGEPTLTYSNNVNPGTATVTMTYNGVSVSADFTIKKASQNTPKGLTGVPESISGKADGEIYGLTTAMEYSIDDANFTAVTDTNMKFAAGTYYIRYAETDFYLASSSVTVTVEEGAKLAVTFVADGTTVATKEVSYGATLTDIPEIPAKVGYDKVAPTWDVTDFTNITTDITVNAVYTINTYTVKYIADGVVISEQTINHGANAVAPEIPAKDGYTETAPYWETEANNVTSDLTINAVYTINTYTVKYIADGVIVSEQTVKHGDDAVAPEIPAKDGYTETAPYWETEANNVTSDLTINAVYTKDIPKITPADTNNDGKVNLKDLVTLAQYVAGWQNTDAYVPALDIDGNNKIDLEDVTRLANYLAGWDVEISENPYLG